MLRAMARSKGKGKPRPKQSLPQARALPAVDPRQRRIGLGELAGGAALVLLGVIVGMRTVGDTSMPARTYLAVFVPLLGGLAIIAHGAMRLRPAGGEAPRGDVRRWIYGGLGLAFAIGYAIVIVVAIPNRLPAGALHLWTAPLFTALMAGGALAGGRYGWWLAVVAGSALLVSTMLIIVRILVSAAFLAGVYGAFGKAAATFALVACALIVEMVALLPICCVKFMMSRVGRRAYGVG